VTEWSAGPYATDASVPPIYINHPRDRPSTASSRHEPLELPGRLAVKSIHEVDRDDRLMYACFAKFAHQQTTQRVQAHRTIDTHGDRRAAFRLSHLVLDNMPFSPICDLNVCGCTTTPSA